MADEILLPSRGSYDRSVLEATIIDGVSPHNSPPSPTPLASTKNGKYTGLTMGQPFTLYFDDNALIVQPEVARAETVAGRACNLRSARLDRSNPLLQHAS